MTFGWLKRVFDTARQILGDGAYQRYAEGRRCKGEEPVSEKEFYVSQLQRKYTRPSRCC